MAFTKKFTEDPLRNRVYLLVHSEPKVGKTRCCLDLVRKHGDYVVMFSFDEGTFEVRQDPETYEGKLAISKPTTLATLRADMHEGEMLIERLVKSGVPRWKIWTVIDTATHMQQRLMVEARSINIKNPDARDSRRDVVRDATTEVDFNINLAHMTEVANWLSTVKCNVVVNALSREEFVDRKKTGRVIPALQGQSAMRFTGDADAILYLERDDKENRTFVCDPATGGDRSGKLESREPADLTLIVKKMLGRAIEATTALPEKTDDAAPAPPQEAVASKTDAAVPPSGTTAS
jgi:hypothetical protein